MMLVELIDGRFRYRLVGSAFWDRYGFELTGRQIEGANPAEAEWLNTLKAVCADRAPRLVTAPVDGHGDKLHVGVALPLSGPDGEVCQILGATFYAQEYGENLRIGRLFVREILDEGR